MCTGPVLFQHGAIPDTAVDLYRQAGVRVYRGEVSVNP